MLFELFNVPASFQKFINKIFAEKLEIFVIIYLDGILIYTKKYGQLSVETIHGMLKNV